MIVFFLHLNLKYSQLLEKLRRVDWVGSFLFIASATSFLMPITWVSESPSGFELPH